MPKPHRVLVVDDHEDTCIGMKMMLQRRGYQIAVAAYRRSGLEKSRSEDFDLLISDIGLPDRSGYELMRELSDQGLARNRLERVRHGKRYHTARGPPDFPNT